MISTWALLALFKKRRAGGRFLNPGNWKYPSKIFSKFFG
jgi:hypothetical protein